MNPEQRAKLAQIRGDLAGLMADLRVCRNTAPSGEKAAFRRANNRLEHADAQLKFAEQDNDRGR